MRGTRRLRPARAGIGVVAALLGALLPGCDWPDGTRYVDTVFANVEVTHDVVYRHTTTYEGQPIDLKLDVYQPRGDAAAKRPAVMWMFGGAWITGDKSQMAGYATDSAERGYVGVSIDYRIRPNAGSDFLAGALDAYDDAVAAVQWLKDNAATYRIDPQAIVAAGYSAGAINALNLLYSPGSRGPETSPVAGAVAIAGLSFNAPTAGDPPAMMNSGTNDTIVPYDAAKRTCDTAGAVGDVCEFWSYENAGHEIGITQAPLIEDRAGRFIFEKVLWPLGYRPTPGPAAT
jgi:Carboxylesterase family